MSDYLDKFAFQVYKSNNSQISCATPPICYLPRLFIDLVVFSLYCCVQDPRSELSPSWDCYLLFCNDDSLGGETWGGKIAEFTPPLRYYDITVI